MSDPFNLGDAVPQDEPSFGVPDHKVTRERSPFLSRKPDSKPRTTSTRERKPRASVPYKEGMFVKPLTELYGSVGMVLAPFDQTCAQAFMINAESCAQAMDLWAKDNEAVRRVLSGLVTTSTVGKVIMAHAPLIATIAAHHSSRFQGMMVAGFGDKVEAAMRSEVPEDE